jgi:hypothetical protein
MRQPTLLNLPDPTGTVSSALISADGQYRYILGRTWEPLKPRAIFIMLNPSTADNVQDDRTIGRCRSFAEREGCGSLTVVNLFALRSTDPRALRTHRDPVGPENDFHLRGVLTQNPGRVIAAWGAHPFAADRAAYVQELLADTRLTCLGTTKAGHPRHPLYVAGNQPLIPLRKAS